MKHFKKLKLIQHGCVQPLQNVFLYNLGNIQVSKMNNKDKKGKTTKSEKILQQIKNKRLLRVCRVCLTENKWIDKGILRSHCYSSLHRRHSKLKPVDINGLKINKWDQNLPVCMNLNLPFNSIAEKDLIKGGFNSNVSCKFCYVSLCNNCHLL